MSSPKGSARLLECRAFFLLILVTATGCASSVRLLNDTPDGGVISIPNNSNQWPSYYRNRAEHLMSHKCPNGYVIDHEEVTEDNPASRDGRYPNEDFEYNGAYERISRYTRTEYRLTFHGVPARNRPPTNAPPKSGNPGSSSHPLSPPAGEGKEELPPPRPLSPPSEREKD